MSRNRRDWLPLLAAAMWAAIATPCFGQAGSLFGSNGPLSQSSAGGVRSNGSNGTAFGSNGFPSLGNTASQFGASNGGQFGGMQAGADLAGGQTSGSVARTSGVNGQAGVNGQGGINGRAGTAGRNGQLGLGGNNRLGLGGLGRNNRNSGNANRNRQNFADNQNGSQSPQALAQPRIRPQVSFPFSRRPVATVNTAIQTSFTRITRRGPEFGNIDFDVAESGEVVLRGTVPREETAKLAAALVRLEPGVRSVRSELEIVPPPSSVE